MPFCVCAVPFATAWGRSKQALRSALRIARFRGAKVVRRGFVPLLGALLAPLPASTGLLAQAALSASPGDPFPGGTSACGLPPGAAPRPGGGAQRPAGGARRPAGEARRPAGGARPPLPARFVVDCGSGGSDDGEPASLEAGEREAAERLRDLGVPILPDGPFRAERGYGAEGGEPFRPWYAVAAGIWGHPLAELTSRGRIDPGRYRFLLPPGDYAVGVGFAELEEHNAGRRVFDVYVQGDLALRSIDPAAIAEYGQAFELVLPAQVKPGGELTVSLRRTAGSPLPPILSFVAVRRLTGTEVPPPPPRLRAAGTYGAVALFHNPRGSALREPGEAPVRGVLIERRGPGERRFSSVTETPFPAARWIDRRVRPGLRYTYRARYVALDERVGPPGPEAQAAALDPAASGLPVYALDLPAGGRDRLLENVLERVEVDGILRIDGVPYPVRARIRGASSRFARKLSYRVEFRGPSPFGKRKVLILKGEPCDFTLQQEKLTCDFFRALGLPVSGARYVNFFLDGAYEGVYADIERVDRALIEELGFRPGTLVRADSFGEALGGRGDLRFGERQDYEELLRRLNRIERGEFGAFIRAAFDWARLRDYLAATFLAHRSEIEASDTFFFRDGRSGLWYVIPWDHNNGNFAVPGCGRKVGEPFMPFYGQTLQSLGIERPWWHVLYSRVFQDAGLRAEYAERVEELARDWLLAGALERMIARNWTLLEKEVPRDPYRWPPGDDEPFLRSLAELKRFAQLHGRRAVELARKAGRSRREGLVIAELGFENERGWCEIENRGNRAARLESFAVFDLERPGRLLQRFGDGDLVPGSRTLVSFDPFRGPDPRGGALALVGPGEEISDWMHFGRMPEGYSYGRLGERFGFMNPTPGQPNVGPLFRRPYLMERPVLARLGQGRIEVRSRLLETEAGEPPEEIVLHWGRGAAWRRAPMEIAAHGDSGPLEARAVIEWRGRERVHLYMVARTRAGIERAAPLSAPEETYAYRLEEED